MTESPEQRALSASTLALVAALTCIALFLPPLGAGTVATPLRAVATGVALAVALLLALVGSLAQAQVQPQGIATELEQQVRALRIPTLIIATAQDAIHPLSHALALHGMIDHSRLIEITPKGVDKARYVSEFQSTLLKFFEDHA